MTTRGEIISALETIIDPELQLDLWYLGLIYDIDIDNGEVYIEMTFTSPLCPAGPFLIHSVKETIGSLPGVEDVDVNVVFDPPWQPPAELRDFFDFL